MTTLIFIIYSMLFSISVNVIHGLCDEHEYQKYYNGAEVASRQAANHL